VKLRDYLYERRITQDEFAAKLGVTRTHFSCVLLQKRNPGRKLAKSIEIETDGIITSEEVRNGEALGYPELPSEKINHTDSKKVLSNNSFSLL